jgi:hypothetical protein
MRTLILLLSLITSVAFAQNKSGYVSYWYTKSDSLVQGEQTYVAFKYVALVNFSSTDTLSIQVGNDPYIVGQSSSFEAFKINVKYLDTIPKQSDGTTRVYFTIPSNFTIGNAKITLTYCTTSPAIYVRSATPDITMISWKSGNTNFGTNDTTGESFSFVIDYSYKPVFGDKLLVMVGDSIVYKGVYSKKVNIKIPLFPSSGNYNLSITGWNSFLTLNITKPSHVVNSIIDPINNPTNIPIHYYNIQGLEIEKPSKGLIIWKTETGESGKIFLSNY